MQKGSRSLLVLTPYGRSFEIPVEQHYGNSIHYKWFNPRNGKYINPKKRCVEANMTFDPPADPVRGNDWVLITKADAPLKINN